MKDELLEFIEATKNMSLMQLRASLFETERKAKSKISDLIQLLSVCTPPDDQNIKKIIDNEICAWASRDDDLEDIKKEISGFLTGGALQAVAHSYIFDIDFKNNIVRFEIYDEALAFVDEKVSEEISVAFSRSRYRRKFDVFFVSSADALWKVVKEQKLEHRVAI